MGVELKRIRKLCRRLVGVVLAFGLAGGCASTDQGGRIYADPGTCISAQESWYSENAKAGLDPKPVCKVPPRFPESCVNKSNGRDVVTVAYDVSPAGQVENVRVVEATSDCFAESAAYSVSQYQYEETESGGKDLETVVTFNLAN